MRSPSFILCGLLLGKFLIHGDAEFRFMHKPTTTLMVAVLLVSSWLHATAIVIIQTNDGYWIGADGVRSFGSSNQPLEEVCKIHQVHGWLLIKSGPSQSLDRYGRDYSVDAEVKKLTDESPSVGELKNDLKDKFLEDEIEVIRWYVAQFAPETLSEPNPLTHYFENPISPNVKENRVVTLIGYDTDQLVNLTLDATPKSYRDTGDARFPYRFAVNAKWIPTPFDSGPMKLLAYPGEPPVKSAHPDEWITKNPAKAIREVLKNAHDGFPNEVGPPYTIVHIRSARKSSRTADAFDGSKQRIRIDWVEKGACPGWTTDLLPDQR
jgi:hypothetical protein